MSELDGGLAHYPVLDGAVTAKDLLAFLATREPENQVLEYKGNLDATKLVPTIGAFANAYGGYLLVGVPEVKDDEGRTVPGAPNGLYDGAASSLRRKCRDSLDPPFTIDLADVRLPSGGSVLIVRVPPLPELRPVLAERRVWIRDGDQTVPASRNEIRQLCFDSPAVGGSSVVPPANLATRTSFITDLSDPWITIRGICSAAPPVGPPRPEVDRVVRSRVVDSLATQPLSQWFNEWSAKCAATPEPWAVSGPTTSAMYDTTMVALAGGLDVVRARVRFGIGSGLSPLAGLWCVADLSVRPHDPEPAAPAQALGQHAEVARPPLLSLLLLRRSLATALATAEHVVSQLAMEYDQPRPRLAQFAGGLLGEVADQLDLQSTGRFSEDPTQRLQHGWQFTEPAVRSQLGEFDADAVAERYLDRFLLDVGAL
jgi:hypothetical protein